MPHAVELARASQRSHPRKGTEDRITAHSWLIDTRVFFADISTWATETGSPFAAHAPSSVVLARHDLRDSGFANARKRQQARLTSTVLDLQREIPNIRAAADQRIADRGGLRTDHLRRAAPVPARRQAHYLLHIKPSKFGRAQVIPIGDQLGRAIAEIIRHVRGFYGTDHVPLVDRRDEHEKRPLPRAPYLLQGIRYPSAVNTNTVRGRHAQPKKSALPVFRRMLHSHTRALDKAREHGEPAGQIAARELEIERIRSAMQRAQELSDDAAEVLAAAAAG